MPVSVICDLHRCSLDGTRFCPTTGPCSHAEYYAAISASGDTGESTEFIEFMLSTIKASLIDAINMSDEMSDEPMDKATLRWKQIEKFLETHEFIMNADVCTLCKVSAATANRILAGFATEGTLVKCRDGGHWAYKLKR